MKFYVAIVMYESKKIVFYYQLFPPKKCTKRCSVIFSMMSFHFALCWKFSPCGNYGTNGGPATGVSNKITQQKHSLLGIVL